MNEIELLKLKIDILLHGVQINLNEKIFQELEKRYNLFEKFYLFIANKIYVAVSISFKSPIKIIKIEETFYVCYEDQTISAEFILPPSFLNYKTSDGTSMNKVGTFQIDRIRISIYKGCYFDTIGKECRFCEIGGLKTLKKNKIENIKELIGHSEKEKIKHYLISGGTPPPKGWDYFINVCEEIRKLSAKSLYAMFSPPPNLKFIDDIVKSGVNEIGINIELYNRKFSQNIMPGKGVFTLNDYYNALEHSVKLLGNRGNVRSILIVGLEDYKYTLKGVEELALRGIMPILSIFKPIKGTCLGNKRKPQRDTLIKLWYESQNICEKNSLTLGPLCVCCQNNTLSTIVSDRYYYY
jgi:hypothetical protein